MALMGADQWVRTIDYQEGVQALEISLPTDADGFLYMQSVAVNVALGLKLKKLERQLNGMSKGFLKVDMTSDLSEPSPAPTETDDLLDILHLPCCKETVKATRHERHFCTICGTEIDMTISDTKKVFLIHKGDDKELVIDFKETLKILGYDPWLDEDAMPDGASVEQEPLQGMQDSCGVVFFITSSFKDEGFLKTEIEYANKEKRKKGDKFVIIPLQFAGADGNTSEIPKSLEETYDWKKPKTPLEALREIVRALLVAPVSIDWRGEIADVVTAPKTKSTVMELSEEAKAILKAAAAGDGKIMQVRHMHIDGKGIRVGGKDLIPKHDPRTIAIWVGGLEDLQQRRYIEDRGHEGKVFEVTREGYKAADELPSA